MFTDGWWCFGMDLIYFDESGDDGLRTGASRFLALTAIRIASTEWIRWDSTIQSLRNEMEASLGIPSKYELHTRELLLRKGRYKELQIRKPAVLGLIEKVNSMATGRGISIKSIVVDKSPALNPLRVAILRHLNETTTPCVAISDRGRVPRMKQLICAAYRDGKLSTPPPEFMLEIESRDCRLVQLADFFATAAYLRACSEMNHPFHARMNAEEAWAMSHITEGVNRTYDLVHP